MNIEEICKNFEQEKACRDAINTNYLSKNDYEICDYVINNIPDIDHVSYHGKVIFQSYAIKSSLNQFKKFNPENHQKLLNIIKNVNFIRDYPSYTSGVGTTYDTVPNDDIKIILNPGLISNYHLPKKIHNIDIICLGHEHCHALKETDYTEHKNYLILGEVIPIFYELINYENDFLKEKHLEYRLVWLKNQKDIYLALFKILKESISSHKLSFLQDDINKTINMYEFVKSASGCYLGGFYYALILYNMYKEEPIKILNLVNDVLSNKITTFDMLNELNIYCNITGETFEKEITNIKKVLSK